MPVDPAGGTVLPLGDDDSEAVTLDGDAVSLYGASYATVHVNSNGSITFLGGDTDYSESIEEHFERPRVAPAWDDLNPSQGGAVSYRQLPDRLVVTWENVPQYNGGDANTFQAQLFFDGRIAMTWLGMDLGDCLTGLSAGNGLDPDFLPSLLGAYGDCGPQPPTPASASYAIEAGTSIEITLQASDDGLPGGPLSYRITALPTAGHLADPDAGLIETVPFDLAGDVVRYAPAGSFEGADAFAFRADDGGVPPEGGESPFDAEIGLTIGGVQSVHAFLVDDGDPAWATEGDWAFGEPLGFDGDPSSGFTGANVLGYNLAGDYTNDMPEHAISSGPLDCSQLSGTVLRYQRWLGVESTFYDHAAVRVSTDGAIWTTVWEHAGPTLSESSWSTIEHDISAIADGAATVYLRWVMGTTDGSVTYQG